MQMKNKSSSSDSESTRAAAAAAEASRSLSVAARDAAERLLSHPGGAPDAAPAALADSSKLVAASGSMGNQGSAAASPAKSGGFLAVPQQATSIVARVTATISQGASPKSSASLGWRTASSGSNGCARLASNPRYSIVIPIPIDGPADRCQTHVYRHAASRCMI